VEIVYALDEALRIIAAYDEPDAPAVEVPPRAATGCGWTEAPRGMLWHRYRLSTDGTIEEAKIVPPIALLDAWAGAADVMVVEAVSSGARPARCTGSMPRPRPASDGRAAPPTRSASRRRSSSHTRSIGCRRGSWADGIEGEDFLPGDELSAPVRAAVDAVRRELRERLVTR